MMNILLPSNENLWLFNNVWKKIIWISKVFRKTHLQMYNENFFVNFRKTWSVKLLVFGNATLKIAALSLLEEPGRIPPQLLLQSDPLFEDWEKWKISKSISIYWKITYDVVPIAKKWIIKSKRFSPKKSTAEGLFLSSLWSRISRYPVPKKSVTYFYFRGYSGHSIHNPFDEFVSSCVSSRFSL